MAAYVIGDIEVTDPAAFREYRNRVGATVEQYGGRFVVRGGRVNPKEGDWEPHLLVMLEFPTLEQAERWYNSSEYKPLIALRENAARTQLLIAESYSLAEPRPRGSRPRTNIDRAMLIDEEREAGQVVR
jgi:uncharacterized protein (DUF1330 family)